MKKLTLWICVALVLALAGCNLPVRPETATSTTIPGATAQDTVLPPPIPTPTASPTGPAPTVTSMPVLATDTAAPTPQAAGLALVDKTIKEDNDTPPEVIDIVYPTFTDAAGKPVNGLNNQVEDLVNRNLKSFKDVTSSATPPPVQTGKNGLYIQYDVHQNSKGYASLLFRVSTYFQGASHTVPFYETINYDLAHDRLMQLPDLFKSGADYLPILSQRSIEDLRKQGVLEWEDGAAPNPENFKSWNLTPQGLMITFDPYQVASYAAGYQKVVLPWSSLGDILNPDLGLK